MMPFLFPDWVPWWLQLALLLVAFIVCVSFLLMPFAVFGLKGRLAEVELLLGEMQAELRVISGRLAPVEQRTTFFPAPGSDVTVSGRSAEPHREPVQEPSRGFAAPAARPTHFEPPRRDDHPGDPAYAWGATPVRRAEQEPPAPAPTPAWDETNASNRSGSGLYYPAQREAPHEGFAPTPSAPTTAQPAHFRHQPRAEPYGEDAAAYAPTPPAYRTAGPLAGEYAPMSRGERPAPERRTEDPRDADRRRSEPTLRWPPRP